MTALSFCESDASTSVELPNETVLLNINNGVGEITLNRPNKYNSFTDEMHTALRAAIKILESDRQLRCVVLTGAGKAFCTGQDLNSRYQLVQQATPNLGRSLVKNYNPLIQRLANLPVPVIAAVNGFAAGAGVSLALACDLVVASENANFAFAFAKVGLIPDAGCTWSLVQAVGLARARQLCLLGESITAEQAHQCGLIYKAVDQVSLAPTVRDLIGTLKANPKQGMAFTKRALLSANHSTLQAQLDTEAQLQTLAGRTADYAEAVTAFVDKRAPNFTNE